MGGLEWHQRARGFDGAVVLQGVAERFSVHNFGLSLPLLYGKQEGS